MSAAAGSALIRARHPVAWQAPRPLWRGATPFAAAPQILRFASDDFMEQLIATLTEEPARLSERIATPETWRHPPQPVDRTDPIVRVPLPAPMKAAKRNRLLRSTVTAPPAPAALKLYQPAHQRYYVVAGSLACAIPGLPERTLAGSHEKVHFVLRRLMPAAGDGPKSEYAFVKSGDAAIWQKLAAGSDLAPGEELLPLFPLHHRDEEGRPRILWGGLIPVARREDYMGKPVSETVISLAQGQVDALRPPPPATPRKSKMQRTTRLRMEVIEPWKAMIRAAMKASAAVTEKVDGKTPDMIKGHNLGFQMQSWLLLVDLRKWINDYLTPLEAALDSGAGPADAALLKLWNLLEGAKADDIDLPDVSIRPKAANLRAALQKIPKFANSLDAATIHYTKDTLALPSDPWPDFHFPLIGLTSTGALSGPALSIIAAADTDTSPLNPDDATDNEAATIAEPHDTPTRNPAIDPESLDRLAAALARALPVIDEAEKEPLPHAMKLRDILIKTSGDAGLFAIRMVHVNEDCGPLHPPTLSNASQPFQLASFFDPDAPVRPITVTLPADTSPAGLRKHGRGAAFVMSDMLCGQVQRAKGLGFVDLVRQVLPFPLHKDIDVGDGGGCKGGGMEIGMICSLSIPIITLCALILLIIIVTLLDFIFRWLPWFIACFPVPNLKGKS